MTATPDDRPRSDPPPQRLLPRIAIAIAVATALAACLGVGAILVVQPSPWWPPALLLVLALLVQAGLIATAILYLVHRNAVLPLHGLAAAITAWAGRPDAPPSLPTGNGAVGDLMPLYQGLSELQEAMATTLREIRVRADRFRDFAEASGDVLWESDADHRMTFLGGHGIVASRRHPQEFMARPRWEIALDSADHAKWEAHRSDLDAHRPFRDLRYPVPTADGSIWLRVSGVPHFDETGCFQGYRGITTEITEQVRQEREHRILSERLSLAVRATGIGIYDIDLATGRVEWDETMEALYGLPPGGFGNTHEDWQRFIHPDDMLAHATAIQECIAERRGLVTRTRICRPDGQVRVMQFRTGLLPNAEGRVTRLIGINRDVTEEHEAQERQAALSQRLTLATGAAGIGIFEVDLKTFRVDWDQRMAELYGLTQESFDGTMRTWRRHIDPEEIARIDAEFQKHRYRREPRATTVRITRADGVRRVLQEHSVIRHDAAGEPARMVGVNWDITEEQQSQADLRRLTDRLTLTARTAGIGFCDFEEQTGSAIWDDTLRRIHGVTDDLPARKENWLAILEPADRIRAEAFIRERYLTRTPGSLEYRIRRSDGALRDIAMHIAPDLAADGKVSRLLGAGWDITEEREAQRQLRQARDAAREANLAKDRFLATMSHELRTPLNAVLGFSEVIRDEAVGPLGTPAYREYADDIHRSGEHLLSLVDDLIDTARVQSTAVRLSEERISLEDLLAGIPALLGGEDYAQAIPAGLLQTGLKVDPRLLAQVLVNLISNARKHSGRNTPILLGAGRMSGDALAIWISDEGPGIAAHEQRQVLEPFGRMAATQDAAIPGVGLGLAIARSFVEAHGGQLFLHSAPGLGTTVGMVLPPMRLDWPRVPDRAALMPILSAAWPAGPCLGCLAHEASRIVRGGDADGLMLEHGSNCILTGADGDACAHWGEKILRAVAGPDALADPAKGVQAFGTCILPVDGANHTCLVEVRRGARTPGRAFVTPVTIGLQEAEAPGMA